ncbi:CoA-binding protein [Saccharicrinis aurantiacus]|uniref:CoA-binding protein n=1 Tax=Saccharicrinis aurantiacus TaxID=1849719 RepID=UPI00094FA7D9|nr:CoA-binding protein [Saccharicrinis aurantiacus]
MKTLVIGASPKAERYSNKAIKLLISHGHKVIALGNRAGQIDNTPIVTQLENTTDIDTITMYIGAKHQAQYFDLIKSIQPRRTILNPGTENPELEKFATLENIEIIHACTLVLLSTNQY